MTRQNDTLLSDWPEELVQRRSYRPRPIDPEILNTMNVIEKIGYAPKPAHLKKPQLPYLIPSSCGDRRIIESNGEGVVPVHYRPVEMTFAHLPTDDRLLEVQKYNS